MPRLFWIAGPIERHALAGPFLQRLAIGGDGLFKLCRSALALAEYIKRSAQIVLGPGPNERHVRSRVNSFSASR